MSRYSLIATSSFGLESLVADELRSLGYDDLVIDNGKVTFSGDEQDIIRCNINLRIADRIVIKMAEFPAKDFDDLYEGVYQVGWENLLPENAKIHIIGKSVKSPITSVPDSQAISKKAVIEAMKRKYSQTWFKEDGPVYKIEIALRKDTATLTLDTSGPGLHKRGYRLGQGEAPLRETLAAAIIKISKWIDTRVLVDPLCGSGTIPIEAAMMAKNIAPGLSRSFTAETWPNIPKKVIQKIRQEATDNIKDIPLTIYASDIDKKVLGFAQENAARVGLENDITFQKIPLAEFSSKKRYGCIICNPPYGERIGDIQEIERLYKSMGKTFYQLKDWSYFILTAYERFEKLFGEKASKNRKLYNGKIKCYLYQYFGPLPPKKKNES